MIRLWDEKGQGEAGLVVAMVAVLLALFVAVEVVSLLVACFRPLIEALGGAP